MTIIVVPSQFFFRRIKLTEIKQWKLEEEEEVKENNHKTTDDYLS